MRRSSAPPPVTIWGTMPRSTMRYAPPKPSANNAPRDHDARSRNTSQIHGNLKSAEIPVFATELHEREAFKSVFAFQQTLDGLNPADVPNLDKAKLNLLEFTQEVVLRLKAEEDGRKEEETSNMAGAA